MSNFLLSLFAEEDLEQHLEYIVRRDGFDRASTLDDQIIGKIGEIAKLPFEIGQRKSNYIKGLRKILFKGVNIYFRYIDGVMYVDRIISRFRDQGRQF